MDLLQALSEGSYDLQNNRDLSGDFAPKLMEYRSQIVDQYLHGNTDLNALIAKLATTHNLTDEQIKRVLEEVNNQVYLVLYARMQSSPEREVKFDLASFDKIKEAISGQGKTKVTEATKMAETLSEEAFMEKIASATESIDAWAGTKLEFEPLSSGPDYGTLRTVLKNAQSIVHQKDEQIQKTAAAVVNNACTIGDALLQYEKIGGCADTAFSAIVSEAKLDTGCQKLIKQAAEESMEREKERGKLCKEFAMPLNYHGTKEKEKFSLGDFSFNKSAAEMLPAIESDNRVFQTSHDLAKVAAEMAENIAQLKKATNERREMEKVAAASNIDLNNIDTLCLKNPDVKTAAISSDFAKYIHNIMK